MNKRDKENDISTDKVIDEFMRLYGKDSSKKHHHRHSSSSNSSHSDKSTHTGSSHHSDGHSDSHHHSGNHSESHSSGSHSSGGHHHSSNDASNHHSHSNSDSSMNFSHHHSLPSENSQKQDEKSEENRIEEFTINNETDNVAISKEKAEESQTRAVSKSSHHHHHHHHSSNKDHSYKSRNKKAKKKRSLFSKIIIGILIFILSMIAVAVGTLFFLQQKGKSDLNKEKDVAIESIDEAVTYDNGKTVEYNGKKYQYNDNIVTVLGMGVDQKNYNKNLKYEYGSAGQSDVILVIALDTKTGKASVISIPRDSYVDVDVYNTKGKYATTDKMQICLSYSYGDGNEKSCENVIKSVERLLYGMPINSYAALRLKGIGPINDSIGGVTLTALESIGTFQKGQQVTLNGNNARYYVQQRNTAILNSDESRRERQIQYIKAFANKAIKESLNDINTIKRIYNVAYDYTITDMKLSSVVYLASTFLKNNVSFDNVVSLKGEMVETDTYPEYHLDKTDLYEKVLNVFYTEIK